jgi:hypothetical protein
MISSPMMTICIDDAAAMVGSPCHWICPEGHPLRRHVLYRLRPSSTLNGLCFSGGGRALGFTDDSGIDEVVQAFIEYDLKMQKQLV